MMRKSQETKTAVSLWCAAVAALRGGFLGLFLGAVGLLGYGQYLFGHCAVNVLNDEDLSFIHGVVGFIAGRLAELHWPWISSLAERVALSPDCAFVFRWPAVYSWFSIQEPAAWHIIGWCVLLFAALGLGSYSIRQLYLMWRQTSGNGSPKPAGDW